MRLWPFLFSISTASLRNKPIRHYYSSKMNSCIIESNEAPQPTVTLNSLGVIIVNTDGTLSNIPNWNELTEIERLNIARVIVKRNKQRLEELKNNPPPANKVADVSEEDCNKDCGEMLFLEDLKKVEAENSVIIENLQKNS